MKIRLLMAAALLGPLLTVLLPATGQAPTAEAAVQRMYDDGFEARRGPPTAEDYL